MEELNKTIQSRGLDIEEPRLARASGYLEKIGTGSGNHHERAMNIIGEINSGSPLEREMITVGEISNEINLVS